MAAPIFGFIKALFGRVSPAPAPQMTEPPKKFEDRLAHEQGLFRFELADGLYRGLGDLFASAPHKKHDFTVMPPRGLRACDELAGVIFDPAFLQGGALDPAAAPIIATVHHPHTPPQHVTRNTGRALFSPRSDAVPIHLNDPATQVLEVHDGHRGRLDSMLFVSKSGIAVVVAEQEGRVVSALTQSRELHPVATPHHLHPENRESSVRDGVRQMRNRYISHMKEIDRVSGVSAKDEAAARARLAIRQARQTGPLVAGGAAFTSVASRATAEDLPDIGVIPPLPSVPAASSQQAASGPPPGQTL